MGPRSDDPFDVIRTIGDRYDLLDLLEDGQVDKPDVVQKLGMSRSTVDRAIARLVDEQIVQRTPAGYTLTYPGVKLKECFEECMDNIEPIRSAGSLLTDLPADIDLPIDIIRESEIYEGDQYEPGLPQRRFLDLVDEAERLRGLSPVTNEQYVDTLHRRTVIEERWTEIVTEREIVDYLLETYPRTFRDVLRSENSKLYSYDGRLPIGLALLEGESRYMTLGIYDAEKRAQGLLVSTADSAVQWADRQFDDFKSDATCVESECASLNG